MKRLAGLETEYGCMAPESFGLPAVPTRVRDYIFKKKKLGLIDLHDRDYDEPAGNGGLFFHRRRRPLAARRPGCFQSAKPTPPPTGARSHGGPASLPLARPRTPTHPAHSCLPAH